MALLRGPDLAFRRYSPGIHCMFDLLLLVGGTALILLMDGYASLCARI